MNVERKNELHQLLTESMKYVRIMEQGNVIPNQDYRELYYTKIKSPLIFVKKLNLPDLPDGSIKSQLLNLLRGELAEYIHDDKMRAAMTAVQGGFMIHTLDDLLKSLLRIAVVWGPQKSVDILERSVSKNCISFQTIILIEGVVVEREIAISDGIILSPLSTSSSEFPDYLPLDGFSLTARDFMGKTLMIVDHSVSPAFSKPIDDLSSLNAFKIKIKNTQISGFELYPFCCILSLICNSAIQPSISWSYVEEDEIFHRLLPSGYSYHNNIKFAHEPRITVTESQILNAKTLYEQFINLNSKVRQAVDIAMPRWVQAKRNKGYVDQLIDLGIAFESLYTKPRERNISFNMSIRAAWYLGKNIEERKELMTELKKIYGLRSDAVHTGKFKDKDKEINMRDFINRAQDLCQMSIVKVIREGSFPDWDSLIMGSGIEPKQIY